MEAVDIFVEADGKVTVGVKGVAGPDCTKVTEAIEAALGTVEKRTKTTEYHHQRKATQKIGR